MNKSAIWGFIAGALIGAGIAWFFTRDHYKGTVIATIEADTKKASKKGEELVEVAKEASEQAEKKVKEAYSNIISKNSYSQYYIDKKQEQPEEKNPNVAPPDPELEKAYEKQEESKGIEYISPEEFGELPGGAICELTYYNDGYLTDDLGEVVEDIDTTVGANFADHIGEYGDNSVYVRNHIRDVDYEILAVRQNYVDIYGL